MIPKDELMQMIQQYAKDYNFVSIRKNIEAMLRISIELDKLYKRVGVQDDEQNRDIADTSNY